MIHSVCTKHNNGVDCYDCEIQTHVNALWSHRRDMSLCMISCHAITLKVVSKGIPVLECPGKFSERNLIEDVLNIIEK